MKHRPLLLTAALAAALLAAEENHSQWVWPGASGRLLYSATPLGDRIPDFSRVGYRGGETPPDVASFLEADRIIDVAPREGDDQEPIQNAIDRLSALPPDEQGFRGLVRLAAGEYQIAGQLRLRASGVVLRGAGAGEKGTLLRATGKDRRALILADPGAGALRELSGSRRRIADKYVPVGATSFRLESTEGLSAGDNVVVRRPSTAEWIRDLGMDRIPGGPDIVQWAPGSKELLYERVITRLEGDRVFLDIGVANSFDRRYGGGFVYRFTFPERIREVGLERLAGTSDFASPSDEDHSWDFIDLDRVEDAWVRDISARHFAYAAVNVMDRARRVTVERAECLDPVSKIEGSRRYSFNIDGAMNLVREAHTRGGRHDFVHGSLTYGPNVFLNSTADEALDEAGPHHRWSTGTLFDNVTVNGNALAAWNRGAMGTGHGWSGANMVFWNSRARTFRVQNPFTAQNWVIGGSGTVGRPVEFLNGPLGIYDSHGRRVTLGDAVNNPLDSLYLAQLRQRRSEAGAEFREYSAGDYDAFARDEDDYVYVDAGWLEEVRRTSGAETRGFDEPARGRMAPFTFAFWLDADECVAAATLTLSLQRESAGESELWLDSTERRLPVPGDGVATLELTGGRLELLADGVLNVAVGGNAAIDWARLDLVVRREVSK